MPIVFNKEKGGWGLENPTEEEREDLINFAIRSVHETLGENLANELLRRMAQIHESDKAMINSIPVDSMPQA